MTRRGARVGLLLLLAAPLVPACRSSGDRPGPQAPLEKGLFFEERDDRGRSWPVSAKEVRERAPDAPVERIAEGATVDVNSTLRIELRRDELGSPSGRLVRPDLLERAEALRASLDGFAVLVEAEAAATQAWRDLGAQPSDPAAHERFAELRRARARLLEDFLGPLRDLWPLQDPERERVEEVVDRLLGRDGAAQAEARAELGRLLQERVDRLSGELGVLESEARAVAASRLLRLEAFVVPRSDADEAHPVHVEGYDRIDEKRVESIDRLGLRLTESERRFLVETSEATREIAGALERVRIGEASLSEALAGAQSSYARALEAKAAEIEALAGELSSEALRTRVERTRTALDAFLRDARARAEAWASESERELADALRSLVERSEGFAGLARAAQDAVALRARWRAALEAGGATDLPALVADTLAAAQAIRTSLRGLDPAPLGGGVEALLRTRIEAAPAELRAELEAALGASGLEPELRSWRELAQRVRGSFESLASLLGGAPPAAVPTNLSNPDAFDVPLDVAPDAEIRLTDTTRRAGDRLLVQAKLLEGAAGDPGGSRTLESFGTTLRLEKLGWHADIVPSVVIVAADKLAGADDVAGFSAALGWMWGYGPRDDEGDPYLSRSLDWSAGLHAVFLNFGPDNDPEIGLGATIGLWDGKIQVGAGYNPFAEEEDDGRFYGFIGSSLVPLLQALTPGD